MDGFEPGEFFDPGTGEVRGAPETGVPGLLPIGRGECIMPAGDDIGKEVAGDAGFGLAMAPGGPRGPWG